jgi:ferredoxin-NADP reductase
LAQVDAGIASSYKVPGQYTKARADASQEKPGFYAMCSAPGATPDTFEFLIKRTPANDWGPGSGWICDLKEGATLQLTEANGGGYKYEALAGSVSDVLLFATGSGIAPVKATIESGILKGKKVRFSFIQRLCIMPHQNTTKTT